MATNTPTPVEASGAYSPQDYSLKIKLPKPHKDISGQIMRGKPVYEEIERMKILIIYESKI